MPSEAKGPASSMQGLASGRALSSIGKRESERAPRILNVSGGTHGRGEHPEHSEHSALAGGTRSSVYRRSARIPPAPPCQSWSVEIEAAEPLSVAAIPSSPGQTK